METFLKELQYDTIEDSRFFYHEGGSGIKLPNNKKGKFWTNYCHEVYEGNSMYITEISKAVNIPLSIGIKCEFETNAFDKYMLGHNLDQLKAANSNVIKRIIKGINVQLDASFKGNNKKFICCLLEHSEENLFITNGETTTYESRIHFPFTKISKKLIKAVSAYIDNMSDDFKEEDSDDDCESESDYDSDDSDATITDVEIRDITVPHKKIEFTLNDNKIPKKKVTISTSQTHYVLYGSTNQHGVSPLQLKKIVDKDFKTMELSSIFNMNDHKESKYIPTSEIEGRDLEFWLPLFFSSGYGNSKSIEMSRSGKTLFRLEDIAVKIDEDTVFDDDTVTERYIKNLIYLLNPERFSNHEIWDLIGQGIWSQIPNERGLAIWKWAGKMNKSEETTDNLWFKYNESSVITHNTIEWYANEDSKKKFEKIMDNKIEELVIEFSLSQTRVAQLASAFKATFPFDFGYSEENQRWYKYENHGWNIMSDDCITINNYINIRFSEKIKEIKTRFETKLKSIPRDQKQTILAVENLIKGFTKIINKILGPSFKANLIKELKNKYINKNFISSNFNTHPFLTRVITGVIDVSSGKSTFRSGKPEDYLTKTAIDFRPDMFTWDSPRVKQTLTYVNQVFLSAGLRTFFWAFMCSLLEVGNTHRIFPIMTGGGNNSKSMLMKLISEAFGSYATVLPTSLISGVRSQADSAMPSLRKSVGTRIAFLQEPEKDAPINSGIVKELTGNDKMYIRDLWQKGSEIGDTLITCVITLVCNQIPDIPDAQKAIWNRARVVRFGSEWTDEEDAPKTETEQMSKGIFKMDDKFDQKIVKMAPAFMWIIYQKYNEYAEMKGLPKPQEIKADTKAFQNSCDIFSQFFEDTISIRRTAEGNLDPNFELKVKSVYDTFKIWVKGEGRKMPKKVEVVERITKLIGKKHLDRPQRWIGMEFKEDE